MTELSELQEIMSVVNKTHEAMKKQNERLIKAVQFYAEADWRELSMSDRGEHARQILREVAGC